MNALISQIMVLAKPSRAAVYRAYLERMPTRELQQKLRDMEESQTRSGNGYCLLRGLGRSGRMGQTHHEMLACDHVG